MSASWAEMRGEMDGRKGISPLFRSTRARGIVADTDDPQADDWSQDERAAYIAAYDRAYCSEGAA